MVTWLNLLIRPNPKHPIIKECHFEVKHPTKRNPKPDLLSLVAQNALGMKGTGPTGLLSSNDVLARSLGILRWSGIAGEWIKMISARRPPAAYRLPDARPPEVVWQQVHTNIYIYIYVGGGICTSAHYAITRA